LLAQAITQALRCLRWILLSTLNSKHQANHGMTIIINYLNFIKTE